MTIRWADGDPKALDQIIALAINPVSHFVANPMNRPVAIDITYESSRLEANRHDYLLKVFLENTGTETISDYHVDLEMPAQVVQVTQGHRCYVPDRSDSDVTFFRAVLIGDENRLYPGDTKEVIRQEYFVDDFIYSDIGLTSLRNIRVAAYCSGEPTVAECEFRSVQNF